MEILISLLVCLLLFPTIKPGVADQNDGVTVDVRVGLVVDLGSTEGNILETSFALALSDFYRINNEYQTRVSVLARDSQGDPLLAYSAVTNLIKNAKVEAIIGAQSLQEAKLLAVVSKKAKVPVISLIAPDSLSLNRYDHFIQTTHDQTSEAKGITSVIHDLNRTSVVVIYEDADDWRESLQTLVEHFQDERISIDGTASFSESPSGENHMMNQLRKLNKVSRAAVFVVHMSENLVSRLLQCAEKLGLMGRGHVWLLTARSMHHFHFSDHFATRSMQGVIGFTSYVPVSSETMNFTSRVTNALMETKRYSVWAHGVACILATAVEKMSLKKSENVSSNLLETMRQISYKGLSHCDIQMVGNKFLLGRFEIVDMVGTMERRIGLWSCDKFCERRDVTASSPNDLEIQRHRLLEENGLYTASGFCIEVFKTCIAPFNYQLEFIPYNGSYNNLAYLLSTQSDKYDAAVGDITITSNRSLYVDFTLPFTDIGIGILTVKKRSQGMWTFFDPFDRSLWLASGAFFILTGVVVWLVERSVNPEFQGSWGQQLCIMLWFGFSTIVFAQREKLEKMSSRFLVIVWLFVVLILTSSYSANLTSTKTISRIQLNHQAVFTSTTLNNMKLGSINAVEAYAQGLRDGTLSHVINEIPYLNLLLGYYPDAFVMTDRETSTNGFGFMFQKGSGLATNVSREIAKLRSLGTLKDIEQRWFQKLDSLNVRSNADDVASLNDVDESSNRFSFRELRGLFIIAGVAHALVIALHLVHIRQDILIKLQSFYLLVKK
ncbi:glutamate receptor 1.1-like isoform X2 [Raphanus sativus]|uniref:Glutamate receptor n=1 Tax=Raphanus sativus TaxID=3726 RepID=A0A9W3CJZ1_RAPSA|nr:glutamate receptor 1.1-like isoform X2 [Raphanus sativus]